MARALLAVVVGALLLAGCGGDGGRAHTRWLVYRDPARHFSVRYPDTWHLAQRSLTPHLSEPRELLTVATGALPAGGRCAQFPAAAMRAMGNRGAIVTIQERARVHGEPPRPRRFHLRRRDASDAGRCVPGAGIRSWTLAFRTHGRAFVAIVALGAHATRHRRAQALAVLDSFRAGRAR